MILLFILNIGISTLLAMISWLPIVTTLPLIDSFAVTAVGYVYAFQEVFWPVQPLFVCLLLYLPIQFGLILLKMIMGHRAPTANTIYY